MNHGKSMVQTVRKLKFLHCDKDKDSCISRQKEQ